MTALDLALGLGVIGCAAHMVHALLGEPAGEITGDVAPSIVAEQTRPVGVSSTVEPLCLESHLQGALQPDLNPIEMALSKLKAYLRRIGCEPLINSSKQSAKSAICSHQTNAGISSKPLDMHHE